MHFSTLFLLSIFLLAACSQKKAINDGFAGIGVLGYKTDVKVGEDSYMNIPAYNYFVFMYHDSIFHIEIDSSGKQKCYWVDYISRSNKIVNDIFVKMNNGDLITSLENYEGSCAPDIVYLSDKKRKKIFAGVSYETVYYLFLKDNIQKKILLSEPPKVFESKIFEFDSRYLRHYFSDEYPYKDARITQFLRPDKN